jgi:undecaprenyl diphosphate synthase
MGVIPLSIPSSPPPPVHVAIIMDGNGRWAAGRGLRRLAGHRRGAEAVRTAIEAALREGVRYLTLFSFSSENWKRPEAEVSDLMELLRFYLSREIAFLLERGIRMRVIGDRSRLAPDIVSLIEQAEAQTGGCRRLTLLIAISYGGRAEIAAAVRRLGEEIVTGAVRPDQITEEMIDAKLYTAGIPDPDLLIRTSGEKRISNFLLWQCAYAELVFIDTLWPDFSAHDFARAVQEYHNRERRYGAVRA